MSGRVVISLSRAVRIDSVGGGCGDWSTPSTPCANSRRNRLQRSDEVGQKACGVVIPFVQRQPGGRPRAAGDPCADQRGFAKAGGGRDEGQFAVQTLVQPLDQAGAEDHVRPRWGDIEFRGQDWRRHRPSIDHAPSPANLQAVVIGTAWAADRIGFGARAPPRPHWCVGRAPPAAAPRAPGASSSPAPERLRTDPLNPRSLLPRWTAGPSVRDPGGHRQARRRSPAPASVPPLRPTPRAKGGVDRVRAWRGAVADAAEGAGVRRVGPQRGRMAPEGTDVTAPSAFHGQKAGQCGSEVESGCWKAVGHGCGDSGKNPPERGEIGAPGRAAALTAASIGAKARHAHDKCTRLS